VRLVIDTNVLVSGLLNPNGAPGQLVEKLVQGQIIPVYNHEILAEYSTVLRRKKFGFDPEDINALLDYLRTEGQPIVQTLETDPDLPDPDDLPFYVCAKILNCPVVTGNTRHFPPNKSITVWNPAQALRELNKQ